jgi:hypothetical protein
MDLAAPSVATSIHRIMLDNYLLSRRHVAVENYSLCWDKPVYGAFADIIADPLVWEYFHSNGIAESMGGGVSGFSRRIPSEAELLIEPSKAGKFVERYRELWTMVGEEFVTSTLESEIGHPAHCVVDGHKFFCHDLRLVYNLWQIERFLDKRGHEPLVIVEIGGGYGGLAAKLRRRLPKAKIIVIDLPEANAIQTYYLSRALPTEKGFYSIDLEREGIKAFLAGDANYALLPPYAIVDLPDLCADLVINIRSMMEMLPAIIAGYFVHIHRITRTGGGFYCVNRYHKSKVGVPIRIRDYPFDGRWFATVSQPAWSQPAVHEFMLVRTEHRNVHLQQLLASLPPFGLKTLAAQVQQSIHQLVAMLSGKPRNPSGFKWLLGRDGNPRNPIARLKRVLRLGQLKRRLWQE